MRIAFDVQLFLKGDKTGIAWCADNLIKELSEDNNNEYQLNYFKTYQARGKLNELEVYRKNGCIDNACKYFNDALYKLLWNIVPISYSVFFGKQAQITQFFNYSIPPGVKGKKVTIIYDMAYKAIPQTVREKTRRWLELTVSKSCKRADRIITISEFSKSEIIKYLHIEENKIVVMPMGVNNNLFHSEYKSDQIQIVKEKYKIDGQYFLYLGTLEPRKNIERIIEAYSHFIKRNDKKDIPYLVLAGKKGWMYDSIFEKVKQLGIEDKIIFTGYVLEEEAPILMCGARCFIFPSLYEGFGMPVIEAMSCGTPVITSNTTSLDEVSGEAAIKVNPFNAHEITKAMEAFMEEDTIDQYRVKGLKHASKYTWKEAASILVNVYNVLMEKI
ncbi:MULTISPECIES: glycosyltransferase family 4 protein [unclassified Lacrimispora]|uniref:glycosyltransferase family 4 protein n=1 Tax=unclassified Lacrimispora TaxID=2719232 RepID=UPI00376F7362